MSTHDPFAPPAGAPLLGVAAPPKAAEPDEGPSEATENAETAETPAEVPEAAEDPTESPEEATEADQEEEATEPEQDYGSMSKADLVALADERGVDSGGTKAEITNRLRTADE